MTLTSLMLLLDEEHNGLNRTVDTFSSVISGDKSLYQGLINTVAATRATKPIWDYIDPTKEE